MPRGEDFTQRAKRLVDQATGVNDRKRDPAAVALGSKGGRAASDKLTPEQRSERARHAAAAREAKRAREREAKTA